MGRKPGVRFANGSKPCPECGQLCDISASMCARCRGLAQRRVLRSPSLREIVANTEDGLGGCLLWRGLLDGNGYGAIRRKAGGVTYRWAVHRAVYELLAGPIPDGHEIHHQCGVRSCVRFSHLVAVSRREHLTVDGRLDRTRDTKGRWL